MQNAVLPFGDIVECGYPCCGTSLLFHKLCNYQGTDRDLGKLLQAIIHTREKFSVPLTAVTILSEAIAALVATVATL